jgi:hypothetical protein
VLTYLVPPDPTEHQFVLSQKPVRFVRLFILRDQRVGDVKLSLLSELHRPEFLHTVI